MYPKIKVKVVGDDEDDGGGGGDRGYSGGVGQRSPLMGLKAIDFLSIFDFNSQPHPSSVREHQVFPERRARIDNCRVENITPPAVSAPEGKSEIGSDDKKQNMRAGPVPRPRAVLSSPSNDMMIGKKNKKLMEKSPTPVSRVTAASLQVPGNAAVHRKAAATAKASSYHSSKDAKTPRETANERITRLQKGAKVSAPGAGQRTRLHIRDENFFQISRSSPAI